MDIQLCLELGWDWDVVPLDGKRKQLEALEIANFV